MTVEHEKFLKEVDKKYKRMRNTLIGIISLLFVTIVTQAFINTTRSSINSVDIRNLKENVEVLKTTSITKEQFERCIKTFELQFDYFVAFINGNQKEMEKVNDEWKEFRREIIMDKSYNMKFRNSTQE